MSSYEVVILGMAAFVAGAVNGALGYGFSSLTVPIGLLFLTNRTLNPALVLIEICLNGSVLWLNRAWLADIARRTLPILAGLVPGIIGGTAIVTSVDPGALRLITFAALLPLILLQAAGYRKAVTQERGAGFIFGMAVGVLYAVTTISGPPLALALNNQGLAAGEFRAALGVIRVFESGLTSIAYTSAGLFHGDHLALVAIMLPAALLGAPVGAAAIRRMPAETFRRICMSFDAWIVGGGIAVVLREVYRVDLRIAVAIVAATAAIDLWLLYRFFSRRGAIDAA